MSGSISTTKSNSDKNKLMVTRDKTVSVTIENQMIKSNITVKLLGITIDSKLNFQEHIRNTSGKCVKE